MASMENMANTVSMENMASTDPSQSHCHTEEIRNGRSE